LIVSDEQFENSGMPSLITGLCHLVPHTKEAVVQESLLAFAIYAEKVDNTLKAAQIAKEV
jgi:hypothetical protein